jgi:sugar phosphate isomerase/epimerase
MMMIAVAVGASAYAQEIGLQLYTFRKQIPGDVAGMHKRIHEMGIKELEGGDTYGLSMDEYKKILADNDLKMVSVGVDYDKLDQLYNVIQQAKAFGATYVTCFWIPHKGMQLTKDEAIEAIKRFNTAGEILRKSGLTLCYHPHGYEFAEYEKKWTIMDLLIRGSEPGDVKFEMDVFWVKQAGQDPVRWLRNYRGRWVLLHLKDREKGTPNTIDGRGDENTNVVLGTGDVNIAEVMDAAKSIGIKHCFIEDESSKSLEQVPASLAYLKTLK